MSFCEHCVQGVRHEGEPEGQIEMIGGVKCYVGTPTVDYSKDKVVLFLTDAFGIELINNQLLVDDFARNGFKVVAPDIFNGDAVPPEVMDAGKFDILAWFANHGQDKTRPIVDSVVAALTEQGVTRFGTTGYCFGGRYTFDLAFDGISHCSVVAHPSLLKIPEDLEKYASTAKAPLLINSCTVDAQFPPEAQAKADEILGGGKFAPGYKREYFDGCEHGFAVRGDMSNEKVRVGKEGAFKASVEFFLQHL